MTNTPITSTDTRKISVICIAPASSDSLLTTIKQLFSMKPANWKISVDLLLERPNSSLEQLIASLGLAINVVPVKSRGKFNRAAKLCAKQVSPDSAGTLWLDARSALVSDALARLEAFHRQYPNAVLVGPFLALQQSASTDGLESASDADQVRILATQSLPKDAAKFDRNLVFIPASVSSEIGQPVGWLNDRVKNQSYVRRARKAGYRCMELPGKFGELN